MLVILVYVPEGVCPSNSGCMPVHVQRVLHMGVYLYRTPTTISHQGAGSLQEEQVKPVAVPNERTASTQSKFQVLVINEVKFRLADFPDRQSVTPMDSLPASSRGRHAPPRPPYPSVPTQETTTSPTSASGALRGDGRQPPDAPSWR